MTKQKIITFLALGIICCFYLAVPAARAVMPGPNIILIVVDCLRPDHLGFSGYERKTSPAIDRLAQNGMVFSNAYTNAPWTKPSVATLFTSSYPPVHGAIDSRQVLSDSALTMAELLGKCGYRTLFFNGGNPFISKRFNFNQGFDCYHHFSRATQNGADLTHAFLSEMKALKHRKFFAYLHYMDLHAPYTINSNNRVFLQSDDPPAMSSIETKCKVIRRLTAANALTVRHKQEIIALYDGQIRYVDEQIGKIRTFLKKAELLKNTVIIVTADHGEEFWEHNNYEHGHTLYNEILRVPLVISGCIIKPSQVKPAVSLVDVLPTVLDIAGIGYKRSGFQGTSLLTTAVNHTASSHPVPVFATGTLYGNEKYCLIRDTRKMIITTGSKERKWKLIGFRREAGCELYNISNDVDEQHTLKCACDEEEQPMLRELALFAAMTAGFQRGDEVPEVILDGVLKEKMASLGYLE